MKSKRPTIFDVKIKDLIARRVTPEEETEQTEGEKSQREPVMPHDADLEQALSGGLILPAEEEAALRRRLEKLREPIEDTASRPERRDLRAKVVMESVGLGPLEALMEDSTISEIFVYSPERVEVTRNGVRQPTDVRFDDDLHLRWIVRRSLHVIGAVLGSEPVVTAGRYHGGEAFEITMPPAPPEGPVLVIRKSA